MLRITFRQFRCWDNLTIEVPIGSITLIKGNSGAGKTTVLQGITWCLYGNIRLVAPNHLEKAKTKVTIELPYNIGGKSGILSINRQKNPNRLIVSHGGDVYEDKVAQSIIDDMFGKYDIWVASCYIGQGCRNTFLTAPNTGKMELLNSIAFHEEDPTVYIERLDATISETDGSYKGKLAAFTTNFNSFQPVLTTTDVSKALTPEQTDQVKRDIANLTLERDVLQKTKAQRDVNIGILNNLENQLRRVESTSVPVAVPDPTLVSINDKYGGKSLDTPDNVHSNIESAMNIIPLLQRRDDLQNETKKIESQLMVYSDFGDSTVYTQADYQDAISQETSCRDSRRLAQTLGVPYSEQDIKDTIRRHHSTLSSQERLILEQERSNLQNSINTLEFKYSQQTTEIKIPDVVPQEIPLPDYSKYNTDLLSSELGELLKKQGSIQAHVQHLRKGYDVLQCPHCNGPVRYQNSTLTSADTAPTSRDDIISAQQDLDFTNAEVSRVRNAIKSLTEAEASDRASYERSVFLEQKRVDSLKEKVRQLELEKQRRDIAMQSLSQQIQEQKKQLEDLSAKIHLLPESSGDKRILTARDVEQTHLLIARLGTITILPNPPVSSQHIHSCLARQNLLTQNAKASASYSEYLETIPLMFRTETTHSVQSYIDRLRSHWSQIKETASERSRLDQLKISLDEQISNTRGKIGIDPSPDIARITLEISSLQDSLTLSLKAHQAIQYHTQITKERQEVLDLDNTLRDLHLLRQHAVETECRILQQVVDSINSSIGSVCGTLFDRDINITLNLFKTLKTTKNVKPVANFSISYQGGMFDNINQMSGGEGDRASLALTLALSRLSSCPVLMLDESLASLDINMKEAVIRTIRENTNNTVLIIMHDGIEGIFDHVIDLSEVREITNSTL